MVERFPDDSEECTASIFGAEMMRMYGRWLKWEMLGGGRTAWRAGEARNKAPDREEQEALMKLLKCSSHVDIIASLLHVIGSRWRDCSFHNTSGDNAGRHSSCCPSS